MLKLLALLVVAVAATLLGVPDIHATTIPVTAQATALATVAAVAANVEPIFVSVAAAAEILATSRSEIYQKIARGELDAAKDGNRTKITYESVKHCAANMPKAQIKLYVPKPRD